MGDKWREKEERMERNGVEWKEIEREEERGKYEERGRRRREVG